MAQNTESMSLFDYASSIPASLDRGTESRNEAYDRIASELPERRRVVYARVVATGERGLTVDELSAAMHVPPNAVSGRITELVQLGLVVRTDIGRQTRSGSFAKVVVARPFVTAEQLAYQAKQPFSKLSPVSDSRKDSNVSTTYQTANDQPDGLTRNTVPRDQFNQPLCAGAQYLVNGKRVLCFDNDSGDLFIQHCHPIGTALIGSRPQSVFDLPPMGVQIERSNAMDVDDDEFDLEGCE